MGRRCARHHRGSRCAVKFLREMLIDLLQRARRSILGIKHVGVGDSGVRQDIGRDLFRIVVHFVEEVAGAAGAEEMRKIKFGAADFPTDIIFQCNLVLYIHLAGHFGGGGRVFT